jgi:predicted MFS family arabinose efflux permease
MRLVSLRARLLVALAAATIASQFLRSSSGVIAPELVRDLALSPEMLGFANGCFFISLGLAQVPVGMLFDRVGVRSTYLALTGFAALGALLQAWAETGLGLAMARLLMGLGCGASFMGAVLLASRWFAADRLATVLSWVFALSQVGVLLAASPLAAASEAWGWRAVFVATAIGVLALGALYAWFVRDEPPGAHHVLAAPQTAHDGALVGLWRVLRTKDLGPVLAIHTFAYAACNTVLGLWAAPYLADVHRLAPVERGHVLLAMGIGQVAGVLAFGPLDRIFDSRKRVVVGGATASLACLAALTTVSQYPVAIIAHARGLFPASHAGRGITTANLAQVIGAASLPYATGLVVGASSGPGGSYPELAYRLVFATIAASLAAGLAFYLQARDVKPSQHA